LVFFTLSRSASVKAVHRMNVDEIEPYKRQHKFRHKHFKKGINAPQKGPINVCKGELVILINLLMLTVSRIVAFMVKKYQYQNFVCIFSWLSWFFNCRNVIQIKAQILKYSLSCVKNNITVHIWTHCYEVHNPWNTMYKSLIWLHHLRHMQVRLDILWICFCHNRKS